MIVYCDVENCTYNECGMCCAGGKIEIMNRKCETFIEKESEV